MIEESSAPPDPQGDPLSAAVSLVEADSVGLDPPWSGVRRGPLVVGERVSITDPKGRRHSVVLSAGKQFHSTKGLIDHDRLIGGPDAVVVCTTLGVPHVVARPPLEEYTVSMPRGATVIYPKDASYILMFTDIFPGARVLEAGAGSGGLSVSLLRAIGPDGRLYSYERREDFARTARENVEQFFGAPHPAWRLTVGDLVESYGGEKVDRMVLDMLAPWECIGVAHQALEPGGWLCVYVATTTQMSQVMDTIRAHGGWVEPRVVEVNVREWHAEGLAVRPGHAGRGHTGFVIHARRLADGVKAPLKRRRPAPGAYGEDYHGPRPREVELFDSRSSD